MTSSDNCQVCGEPTFPPPKHEWFRWQKGRQATGYCKLLLARSQALKCDLWLLKYAKGHEIPTHVDKVPDHKHIRVNLILWQPFGGHFFCDHPILRIGRLHIFRSDYPHRVTKCYGSRIVLSLGFARKA